MEGRFASYLSSPSVTILVGEEKERCPVPVAVFSNLSTKIAALINDVPGHAPGGSAGVLDWSGEIDKATFVRLYEFAYMGDYTPLPPAEKDVAAAAEEARLDEAQRKAARDKKREDAASTITFKYTVPKIEPSSNLVEDDNDPFNGRKLRRQAKRNWGPHLEHLYQSLVTRHERSHNSAMAGLLYEFAPAGNSHPNEDFTPVFLGHVNLYILASKFEIFPLIDLAWLKLAATLKQFTLSQDNLREVLELVRVSYQRTDPGDSLRKLLTAYILSVIDRIGDCVGWTEIMAEGGDFVCDFWRDFWQ